MTGANASKLQPFNELPGLAQISGLRGSIFVGRLIAELPTSWSVPRLQHSQSTQVLAWSGLGSSVAQSLDISAAKDFPFSFGIDRRVPFQILSVHQGNWRACAITFRFLYLMTTRSCRPSSS